MTHQSAPTSAPDDPASGSSRGYVASAVIVAAIALLGLGVSLTNVFGSDPEPPPSVAATSASDSVSASAAPDSDERSVCGLDRVEMSGTVTSGPEATWSLIGSTAAPSIKGEGPGKVDSDGYPSCFARTPTGAVVAAANYLALGSYPPLRKKFFSEAAVPGPGRDALLKTPPDGAGSSGVTIQTAGFRVIRYDGSKADIDIAVRASNGVFASGVFNLQWVEGDWKLGVADDGSQLSPVTQIPSLSGYVPWGGA